ncbi:MAG: hypothetical protein ABIP68_08995 [Ferruginibacter sp.]
MSFQLPPFLVQSFYKDLLFDFSKQPETLGNYEKQILIIVNYPYNLHESDLEFLTSILKACSLGIKDIRIINLHNIGLLPNQIIANLKPLKVLFFGVDVASFQLPLQFPDFQVQSYDDTLFLSAPSLAEISSSAEVKKKLWQNLQKMFL